ncbi:DDE-type integrase/transposase/recombinase [Skermanella stibiiresistens]|nr:DDE-type integrase/transposase/recombinase [Skermanella stibiiresistens]
MDEVVLTTGGRKHYLCRVVDWAVFWLDVLVQSWRYKNMAKRQLLKEQGRTPRVIVTGKLEFGAVAKKDLKPPVANLTTPA